MPQAETTPYPTGIAAVAAWAIGFAATLGAGPGFVSALGAPIAFAGVLFTGQRTPADAWRGGWSGALARPT